MVVLRGGRVFLVSEVLLYKVSLKGFYISLPEAGPLFPLRKPLCQDKPRFLFPVEEGTVGRKYSSPALPKQLFRPSASRAKKKQPETFKDLYLKSKARDLPWTDLYVPYLLDSGGQN